MPCDTKMKKGKGKKKGYRCWLLVLLLAAATGEAFAQAMTTPTTSFGRYLTLGGLDERDLAGGVLADATRVYGWGPAAGDEVFVTKITMTIRDAAGDVTDALLGTSTIVAASQNMQLAFANVTQAAASNCASASATVATTNWNTVRTALEAGDQIGPASPPTEWDGTTNALYKGGFATNFDLIAQGWEMTADVLNAGTDQVMITRFVKDLRNEDNRWNASSGPVIRGYRLVGDTSDSGTAGDAVLFVWPRSLPHNLFTDFHVYVEGYYAVGTP